MPEELEIAAVPAARGPGRRLDRRRRLARRTRPRAPGSAPPACAGAPSCSPPAPTCGCEELHGNVDTRLRKLAEGDLDAIVLAAAGLRRLGREAEIGFRDPGRRDGPGRRPGSAGAPGPRRRRGDGRGRRRRSATSTPLRELTAERAAVALLEATCATPIGVHARVEGERLGIEAFVGLPDGSEWLRDRVEGDAADPVAAGTLLAERLLSAGARELLERAEQTRPPMGRK